MDTEKFKSILESSYLPQAEASAKLEQLNYTYDPELSTMESKVFIDKETGKPNIVFRGSTRVSDFLIEDPAVAFGIKTEKQKRAETLTKTVEKKYGQPVDVYGHSLGGTRAEKSGATGNIYTYNKGAGLFDIGKTRSNKQIDYRKEGDIVSLLSIGQRGGKTITEKPKKKSTYVAQILESHKFV
jgi:hypothetical protein